MKGLEKSENIHFDWHLEVEEEGVRRRDRRRKRRRNRKKEELEEDEEEEGEEGKERKRSKTMRFFVNKDGYVTLALPAGQRANRPRTDRPTDLSTHGQTDSQSRFRATKNPNIST